ncbi:unnamed protein product, partial [Ectocarpus sp. 12 AP-2014]
WVYGSVRVCVCGDGCVCERTQGGEIGDAPVFPFWCGGCTAGVQVSLVGLILGGGERQGRITISDAPEFPFGAVGVRQQQYRACFFFFLLGGELKDTGGWE